MPPKEGFKLWPFKTLKETKAESPQKCFPQLSNIQENSQYSESNAPVPPVTPGGSSLVRPVPSYASFRAPVLVIFPERLERGNIRRWLFGSSRAPNVL